MSIFSRSSIAIDLGTANTLIYLKDVGIILNEPSVVAIKDKKHPYAFGTEAGRMLGKTPNNIDAIRPLRDGVIADFKAAELMLNHFIKSSSGGFSDTLLSFFLKRRIIVCVPSGSTPVERRAIQEAALVSCPNSEVFLIEEPMAAAIGAKVDVMQPIGSMIVDIGGGTTEIGVTSLGGLSSSKSIRFGGDKIDEAIIAFIRKEHNLLIGDLTAESIKRQIGAAMLKPEDAIETMVIRGRDLSKGIPVTLTISSQEISSSISDTLYQIIDAIKSLLEKMGPEIAADIADRGIILAGGGALLKNISDFISTHTTLPVVVSEDPLFAIVNGIGKVIDNFPQYRHVLFKQD